VREQVLGKLKGANEELTYRREKIKEKPQQIPLNIAIS